MRREVLEQYYYGVSRLTVRISFALLLRILVDGKDFVDDVSGIHTHGPEFESLVFSSGSGRHKNGVRRYPPPRLRSLREREKS